MDGFELEVHNWVGERTGTVRIKDPHSGVTRVIVHVYDTYVEIIEDGRGGPFVTHILGTPPDDLEPLETLCDWPDGCEERADCQSPLWR